MPRMLVTGFGPFDEFNENPSEALTCALRERNLPGVAGIDVLSVSFRSVDDFIASGIEKGIQSWLMLGVASKAETLRMERYARNRLDSRADVNGEIRGPGPIDLQGPDKIRGRLFDFFKRSSGVVKLSHDAGGFLCNYLYYVASLQRPDVACGFLHVAPFATIGFDTQMKAIERIIWRLTATA